MNSRDLSRIINHSFESILTLFVQVKVLEIIDDSEMIEIHTVIAHVSVSLLEAFQFGRVVDSKIFVAEDLSGAAFSLGVL